MSSLTPAKLEDAKFYALRLIEKIDTLKAADQRGTNPRERGAVKRASMDLTRSLARLRRCSDSLF